MRSLSFVAGGLGTGRLPLPVDRVFSVSLPHYIVTRRGRPDGPALKAFRTWLLHETATAATELEAFLGERGLAPETLSVLPEVLV